MSTFLAKSFKTIVAYKPGEQLGDDYLKLNANESSQAPSPRVLEVLKHAHQLNYYSDPFHSKLRTKLASIYDLDMANVFVGTGADDVLDFIFRTFIDRGDKIAFPTITYSFYKGYADTFGYEAVEVPLTEDYQVDLSVYESLPYPVVVVNPDAPTGLLKPLSAIKKLVASRPDRLVIVDEAYIDFGGQSETAVGLVKEFSNLIVVRTFSKSRQLAGARVGYALAAPDLIEDMEAVRMTVHPFNLSVLQEEVALASLEDDKHFDKHVKEVIEVRDYLTAALRVLGFKVFNSHTNFVYAGSQKISGAKLYEKLRDRHILVRHYPIAGVEHFVRISIGTDQEMHRFVSEIDAILKEIDS